VLIISPGSRDTVTLPLGARDLEWARSEP
jgi:hypothetical protein